MTTQTAPPVSESEIRGSVIGLHVKRVILNDAEKIWDKSGKPVIKILEEWLELGHGGKK